MDSCRCQRCLNSNQINVDTQRQPPNSAEFKKLSTFPTRWAVILLRRLTYFLTLSSNFYFGVAPLMVPVFAAPFLLCWTIKAEQINMVFLCRFRAGRSIEIHSAAQWPCYLLQTLISKPSIGFRLRWGFISPNTAALSEILLCAWVILFRGY